MRLRWPRVSWANFSGAITYLVLGLMFMLSGLALTIALLTSRDTGETLDGVLASQVILHDIQTQLIDLAEVNAATITRIETFIQDELADSITAQDLVRQAEFQELLRDIRSLRFTVESSEGTRIIISPVPAPKPAPGPSQPGRRKGKP